MMPPAQPVRRRILLTDLSTWYVRRNRDRFWAKGMETDKAAAFLTLYEVLSNLSLLIAPMTPFIADELYQNLVRSHGENAPVSVHLCDYPTADASLVDEGLLTEMDAVLHVGGNSPSLRNESKIKTRQPLSTLYLDASQKDILGKFTDTIEDELNVRTYNLYRWLTWQTLRCS